MAARFEPRCIISRGEDPSDARKEPSQIRLENDYKETKPPAVTSRTEPTFNANGFSFSEYSAGKNTHSKEDDSPHHPKIDYHDERKDSPTRSNSIKRVAKLTKEQYPPFDSPLRSYTYRKNHYNDTPSLVASRTETTFALNEFSFSHYDSSTGGKDDSSHYQSDYHFDERRPSSKIHDPAKRSQDCHRHHRYGSSLRAQSFREPSRIYANKSVAFIDEPEVFIESASFSGAVHEHSLPLVSPSPLHVAGNSPGSSKYTSSQLNRRADQFEGVDNMTRSFHPKAIDRSSSITLTSRKNPQVASQYHRPKSPPQHSHYPPQQGIPQKRSSPEHGAYDKMVHHRPPPVSDNHNYPWRKHPEHDKFDYLLQSRADGLPLARTFYEAKQYPPCDARSLPNPLPQSANFSSPDEPKGPYQQDTLPPPPIMPPIPSMAFGSHHKVSTVTTNSPSTPRAHSLHIWHQSPYNNNVSDFFTPKQPVDSRSMPYSPYPTDSAVSERENSNPPPPRRDSNEFSENSAPLTRVELDATLAECESFYEYARSVFDDEDVLREAIKARDIIEKTTVAIATGNFPTVQELEERLEHMRQSSLTKSPEEKLRQIPVLKEIKKKLAMELETGDSLSLSSGGPAPQSSTPTDTRSVFISYTGQDAIAAMFAASLSLFLDKSGVSNFFDVSGLQIGVLWDTKIERSVADCYLFVSLLSPMYPFRKWCMNELDIALRNNKKIIPVCVGSEPYKLSHPFRSKFFNTHRAEGLPDERIQQWEENLLYQSRIQAARNFSTNKNAFTALCDCVINAIHANLQRQPHTPFSPTGLPQRSKPTMLSRRSKDVSNRISAQVPLPTPDSTATENAMTQNEAQQNDHLGRMLASYDGGSPRESGAVSTPCNMLTVRETRPVDPMCFTLTEEGDRAAATAMRETAENQPAPPAKSLHSDVQNADHIMLVSAVVVQPPPPLAPAVPGKKSFWKRLRDVVRKKKGGNPEASSISATPLSYVIQAHALQDENQQQLSTPRTQLCDHIPLLNVVPNFKDQVLPGRAGRRTIGSGGIDQNEHGSEGK